MPTAYTPLIATKIGIPPLRSQAIVRPRLFALLDDAVQRALTVISAPAGFGKTTLMVSWLKTAAPNSRVAWLSLDSGDSDPVHFLHYLIAALHKVEPRLGRAPISLIGSLRIPEPKDLIALVINELAEMQEPLWLILDDYHSISNPEVDSSLELLVERMPDSFRLIVLAREEPRLPFARWRTQGRAVELGPEDLRFNLDEAVLFLRQTMGLEIDPKSVRSLENRTEGWVAGLQMAALSLRPRVADETAIEIAEAVAGFSGRNRYVVDYLAVEVLRRQPDEIRTFLHQTAVLERFCAPLCDAVTGRRDANAMLARLEQANMFVIALDDRREWYRYHQLFADYLRGDVTDADRKKVNRKASAWFEARRLGPEAIKHALAADDIESAVRLIRAEVEVALSRGEGTLLLGWLSALPESAMRDYPDLAGYRSILLYLRGRTTEAQAYSQLANTPQAGNVPPAHQGMLKAFRAYLALNWADPKDATPLAREALSHLGDSASFFRTYALCILGQSQSLTGDKRTAVLTLREAVELGRVLDNRMMTVDALGHLSVALIAQGQLREAIVLCHAAVEQNVDANEKPLPITGLVLVPLGMLYHESDDLDSAERYLSEGVNLCEQLGMIYFRVLGKCMLAKLHHIRGEREIAWTTLAAAREAADHPKSVRRERMIATTTAELQLAEGNIEAAARTMEATRDLPGQPTESQSLVQARLLLAQRSPSLAWRVLALLEESAQREGSDGSLISIYVLQALCKRALGQNAGAQERVDQAVSLAASSGYRRAFLDEGANLAAMLEQARHVAPEFVSTLLEPLAPERGLPRAGPMFEPLNRIELDILGLLNHGLTNREIADKLSMTVGTTKWRMNQIFGKLQVRNRVEALARARQLRLL